MVVADGVIAARRGALRKWSGTARPHVDAVRTVGVVDGYRVSLEATDELESFDIDDTYDPADA